MKTLFTFACIFLASSTFAQRDMFWNHYSNLNPAMSGLQHQQHGAISYSENFLNYGPKTLQANYNMRLADKHGLGFNFGGSSYFLNQSGAMLNYNYQFDLGNAGKLSAGVGAGLSNIRDNEAYGAFDDYDIQSKSYFQLNAGVAYKWKKLTAGVSMRNLTQPGLELDSGLVYRTRSAINIHAEYDFSIGEQFQLTPRFNYGSFNGLQHRLNTDLTLTFKNKFSLGVLYNFNRGIGLHAGWDIKEKFRVAYLYNTSFSSISTNNLQYGEHQITLGFYLR